MRFCVIIACALGVFRSETKAPEVAVVEIDPDLDSGRVRNNGDVDLAAIQTALNGGEEKRLVSRGGGDDLDALLKAVNTLRRDDPDSSMGGYHGHGHRHRHHHARDPDGMGDGGDGSDSRIGSGHRHHHHAKSHGDDEENESGHHGHHSHRRAHGDDESGHGGHHSHRRAHGDDDDDDDGSSHDIDIGEHPGKKKSKEDEDESPSSKEIESKDEDESGSSAGLSAHKMQFSIVRIASTARQANLMEPWKKSGEDQHFVGSGFIIHNDEEGPLIATNAHVISDAHTVCIVLTAKDKTCYRSQVRLVNHEWDLAFLMIIANDPEKKSNPEDPLLNEFLEATTDKNGKSILTVLEIHSKHFGSTVEQGTQVIALGFPLGKQSLALTSGVLSGSEVVHDVIVLQTTAPISPGNSGGPLLINEGPHKGEICGVNFASAVAQGSQNNNFAIPAWRLQQQFAFFKSRKSKFSYETCRNDIGKCEMKVPVPSTESGFIPGNEILYKASGCDDSEGVFVTDVGERTSFAKADPPLKGGMLITSVDGTKIDRFGYGRNTEYLDEKVSFMDLVNFKQDLDQATSVTTCGCQNNVRSTKQEHSVSHEWMSAYETPLLDQPQVALANHDFVSFAGLAMQPLSTALARELIITRQQLNLIPYAMKGNKKCPIVITKADLSASSKDNNAPVVGAVVTHINGVDLSSLELAANATEEHQCSKSMQRLRMAFAKIIDKSGSSCQSKPFNHKVHTANASHSYGSHYSSKSSDDSTIEKTRYGDDFSGDGGEGGYGDDGDSPGGRSVQRKPAPNISYAHVNHVWTLKTQEGHFMAVDFDQALKDMAAVPKLAIDKTVLKLMADRGIELNETAAKEAQKREEEREQEGGGFGDFGGEGGGDYHSGGQSKNNAGHKGSHRHHRNYHRHHSLSELMSREDAELDGDVLPIEYRNVYRGGMTAARDLEYALASPETIWGASSFMEIDQGSVGPASMSSMSLAEATSFLEINAANEMGPGAMEPVSLMQVGRKTHASQ